MEIELKFLIEEEFTKDRILQDDHLRKMTDEAEIEVIPMRALYYDTENQDLRNRGFAFRVRYENGLPVATMKWGGSSEDGLHRRGELNVTVDEEFAKNPDMHIFKGSEIYADLEDMVEDSKLVPVIEMKFVRKQIHVDTGRSISVVSCDEGEIITIKGNAPISELEVELYSGDQDDMIALGTELATKYNLKAEDKSKYQRGLELLGL